MAAGNSERPSRAGASETAIAARWAGADADDSSLDAPPQADTPSKNSNTIGSIHHLVIGLLPNMLYLRRELGPLGASKRLANLAAAHTYDSIPHLWPGVTLCAGARLYRCNRVLRFSLDDLFQRPASDGPRGFSCLRGVGWRPSAQPLQPPP